MIPLRIQDRITQYKIHFVGAKEGKQAYWRVSKFEDNEFIIEYRTTTTNCNCEHMNRRKFPLCRHVKMVKYYEQRARPDCLLRYSGAGNIFEDNHTEMLN